MSSETGKTIRKIALTGGIASGKSLAGEYLAQQGVPVIDVDQVVHRLLREDEPLKALIRAHFGEAVFDTAGQINRAALGSRVFQSMAERKLLESWIHPKTREAVADFFTAHAGEPRGVALIPLLFESNLADQYDEVWLLDTPEALQLARLMEHRGMSREAAFSRIQSQMPLEEKRKKTLQHTSGWVIANDGTPQALYQQLAQRLSE